MTDPNPLPPPANLSRPTYWWIQYLRGFAAAGVVIFHAYTDPMVPLGLSFEIGRHGVDVFFVISGFIMYSATRDKRIVQFITGRLIRVFPLYWLATALSASLFFAFDGGHASGTEAILSLALIPHYSEAHRDQIWPILIPGWTLTYEMFFYGLFALGIAARRVVAVPALAIVVLVTVGVFLKPHLAPLVVATNPLLLEFLLGLLIALAMHRLPALIPGIVVALLMVSVGGLVLGWTQATVFAGAGVIVAGAVWFERRRSDYAIRHGNPLTRPVSLLRLLGDASYSIYLFHTSFLLVIDRLFAESLAGASQLVANAVVIATIAGAIVVGVLLHLALEEPVLRMLKGWNRRVLVRLTPVAVRPA